MNDTEQRIQENQYEFPYHHLVQIGERFSQSKTLSWGYEYASYVKRVLEEVAKESFQTLADVGCGDGKFVHEAHLMFPDKRIVGVDYSEHAIQFARAFNPDCELIVSDLLSKESNELAESFDIVTLIEVLEHIPPADARAFISSVVKLLRPGGRVIMTVPSDNVPRKSKHYRHFNRHLVRELFDNIAKIETIEYLNKKSPLVEICQRLISNGVFTITFRPLTTALYNYYVKSMRGASEQDGKRLFIVARKQ